MDKILKVLKVAAYVGEVIVASSVIAEVIGKIRSNKTAPVMAAADNAASETHQTNPA